MEFSVIFFIKKTTFSAHSKRVTETITEACVTIMFCNDELSWLLTKRFRAFIAYAENSQILLKISVIPILLTFIYLITFNLLV